ncbi:unnamed protein product [Protopolystoma xenopodis]|uniref:Uncharacterized protein n=1 Tax=Protopolystoma xenopodis TaxID=117903 RepID=A0A448X2I6_9PLAT|nr:unnamed protein product [Protopolystoma xenopodis]
MAVHNKVIRSGNDLKSTGEMSVLGDGPGAATVEGTPQTIRRGSSNLVSGFSEAQLVAALAACEEESDAVATNRALAEAKVII